MKYEAHTENRASELLGKTKAKIQKKKVWIGKSTSVNDAFQKWVKSVKRRKHASKRSSSNTKGTRK